MTKALQVGINAIFLEPAMGGLETYVLELVPALLRLERPLEVTVLCNAQGRQLLAAEAWADEVALSTPRASQRGLRALFELGPLGALSSRRFDVLHSPALTAPLATRAANVVVLADTTWITMPSRGRGQTATTRIWRVAVPRVARRADRVVAISSAGAADVERHLRVPRERIEVIPLGVSASRRAQPLPGPALRRALGLADDAPLLFNVGAKKVHKNQLRLVQALPAIRAAVPGAQLVVAGAPTSHEVALRAEAERLGLADHVRFPGYVTDEELEGLYASASAFLFPSLNEGFGLPVLEAMARGVPVVTSSTSSLPEVAGDAALLVNPESVDEIAGATVRLLRDDSLRERLVQAGHDRPAAFTWERTAQATMECWDRAIATRDLRRR